MASTNTPGAVTVISWASAHPCDIHSHADALFSWDRNPFSLLLLSTTSSSLSILGTSLATLSFFLSVNHVIALVSHPSSSKVRRHILASAPTQAK